MNSFLSRWFVYYPIRVIRGEFLPYYIFRYKQTEWYSSEEIKKFQFKKLKALIKYAYKNVPFYRELYNAQGVTPSDINNLKDLTKLPFISRDDLDHLPENARIKKRFPMLSIKVTGGSTAQPAKIYKNRRGTCLEDAALWRSLSWYNIKPGDRQIRFWGVPGQARARKKVKLIDFLMNRKRIPASSWTPDSLKTLIPMVLKFRPHYFYGYISIILDFTEALIEAGIEPSHLRLKAIVLTAEVPYAEGREKLSQIYKCPVVNEYGSSELGPIAYQCPDGNLHAMFENVYLEIIDKNGNVVPPGEPGEIVVTDLNNFAMPLIRYRSKDYSRILPVSCTCGRNMPVIDEITGRDVNLLQTVDGRKVHASNILYTMEQLAEAGIGQIQFQLVQDKPDHIIVNIVQKPNATEKAIRSFMASLEDIFGKEMTFTLNMIKSLPREPSGKFMMTKNLM